MLKGTDHSLPPLEWEDIPPGWLEKANERYRHQGIPPRQRVMMAYVELTALFKRQIIGTPVGSQIGEWFKANTQPDAHYIGALFTGAFLYDTSFWPITIPIFYGRCQFNVFESLKTMPTPVMDALKNDSIASQILVHYWTDCFDYGLGYDYMIKASSLKPQALKFLESANSKLRGAIAQLLIQPPNLRVALEFGFVCEIILKAFLIQETGATEKDLKKLGHDQAAIASQCYSVKPFKDFEIIKNGAVCFPAVSSRYDGPSLSCANVFDAIFISQLAATAITRYYSGADIREQTIGKYS